MPMIRHEDIPDSVINKIAERAAQQEIPEEIINKIAEQAAKRALEKVYTEVGRSVLTRLLWILGAAGLALYVILKEKGLLP